MMHLKEIYELALKKWGPEAQMEMAKEEAAELIQALCKYGRAVNGSTLRDIAGEIADMEIMLEQLRIIFDHQMPGSFDKLVESIRKKKLERLEELVSK